MVKRAELEFTGDFFLGFTVNLMIYKTDKLSAETEVGVSGKLPPSNLDQCYKIWSNAYETWLTTSLDNANFALKKREAITNIDINDDFYIKAEKDLLNTFNNWLNNSHFSIIKETLKQHLNSNEANPILIKSENHQLRRLPWQQWDLLKEYSRTEIGISSPNFRSINTKNTRKDKVRILVILGKDANIQEEIKQLENLGNYLEVKCIYPQDVIELDQPLWKESWDILLFNGHSKSNSTATDAEIQLDKNTKISISLLRNHLQKAIENGLRLAIFNSCDGLGIGYQLAEGGELHLPQVLVMRELLPVAIAPIFLRYFLETFTQGSSLYQSVREARNRLQILETQYPALSWLPIICQNPAESPLKWHELAPTSLCPYRGLLAFQAEDERFFFGRNEFTNKLIKTVKKEPLVAVIGPSGSGKSSVVFAGLIPQLIREGGWLIQSFRPGKSPFESLAIALLSLGLDFPSLGYRKAENDDSVIVNEFEVTKQSAIQELTRQLKNNYQILLQIIDDICRQGQATNKFSKLLIVADQFEELYTLEDDKQEAQKFLDCILNAVENAPNLKLVLTLRADFYGYALSYLPFGEVLQNARLDLLPMAENELQQVIVTPAQMYDVDFEEGLTERILEKIEGKNIKEQRDNLPLLEFTLTQLWRKQGRGGILTNQVYDELGGIEQALANHAEEIYSQINTEERKQLQQIFVQLIRPGEGTDDTRRIANRKEIKEENWLLVVYLNQEDVRLVVVGYDEVTKQETVEVVHEVLIRGWGRLSQWIQKDREFRLWQEGVRGVVNKWENKDKDEGFLLRGKALVEAEDWLQQRSGEISDFEQDFIKLSVGLREREEKEKKQRQQRTIWGLTSGLFAVTVFAVGAVWQWQRANTEAIIANLGRNAADVKNLLSVKPVDGLVLAIKATGESQDKLKEVLPQVQSSLNEAIEVDREQNRLKGMHGSGRGSIAFSPDGNYIVASDENTVRLWDKQSNPIGQPFSGHEDVVSSVDFSPDGKYIVSGSDDKTIRLWDRQGNPIGQPFSGHKGIVSSVAFSPDGKYIISGSADETIKLWDKQGNLIGQFLKAHKHKITSVAFSPDGNYIVSSGLDNRVKLWDKQGKKLWDKQSHSLGKKGLEWVNSVAFSPDGEYIVSGSTNRTISLWDRQGNAVGQLFKGHEFGVLSVAFSPDGKYIVSGGGDNTIRLWDKQGNPIGQPFKGHESGVSSVAFSPDGNYIVSGSGDRTVRVWDSNPIGQSFKEYSQPFKDHEFAVSSVAFSPNGKYIVSGSIIIPNGDGRVRLWDTQGNPIGQPFTGHKGWVLSVAFSPDGKYIVSSGEDKTIRLWNTQGNPIGQPFKGHEDWVFSVAFSPDSKYIVSGSGDKTVRVWDTQGNPIGQPFKGHQFVVRSVAFSPDGNYIVSGSFDYTVRLWGNPIVQTFKGHKNFVNSVAFSPDGNYIISGSDDKTIRLWDKQGNPIGQPFKGHEKAISSVAFGPDGNYIISGSDDKTIRLWDKQGNLIGQPFKGHEDAVQSVAFSPDGKYIVSGGSDGTVRLWRAGNWLSRLETGCNRLRYHPVLKNPETDVAREAKKTCQKYVWNKE